MSSGRRGSVKQADNGTWYFVLDVPSADLDARGRPKRKQTRRRGFKTRREALGELNRVLATLDTQSYVAPAKQTLAEYLRETWLPGIEHTIRPSTFESYGRLLRLHVIALPVAHKQLQAVDGSDLNRLYAYLLAGDEATGRKPLSRKTVRYVRAVLHRAYRDAVRWNLVHRNPVDASDPPAPAPRQEMLTWTPEQLAVFLEGATKHRHAGAWWLLGTTGMRRGEALGLRWADVDLDRGRVVIRRTLVLKLETPGWAWSQPKTNAGYRTVSIDEETVAALRAHKAKQNQEKLRLGAGYLDLDLVTATAEGTPVMPSRFSEQFLRLAARHGLPRIRLHDLRHTHATHLLQAGIHPRVVQDRLGHANVSITLDIYSHVTETMQEDAAKAAQALRRPSRPGQSDAQ